MEIDLRPLGDSGFRIAPVALGCWPIAGVTTLGTTEADSLATIRACFDLGINHLDTAYAYGPNGESESLIGRALGNRRDEMVIATKGGIHFEGPDMVNDARPETLKRECEESLRRLNTDRVELLYLHSADAKTPIADSAAALRELQLSGKTRGVGASNLNVAQLEEFHAVCPLTAVQVPYNMLQRQVEEQIVPWCQSRGIAVTVYWALMKGLLAGRLLRDAQLANNDNRRKYLMYQGEEWQKNQDFVERLRRAAAITGHTVAQLVINWTIHQAGITAALCGAKRPAQIRETAGAMAWQLTPEQHQMIDHALAERGPAAVKRVIQ